MNKCSLCEYRANHDENDAACRLSQLAQKPVEKTYNFSEPPHLKFAQSQNIPIAHKVEGSWHTTKQGMRNTFKGRILGIGVHGSPYRGFEIIRANIVSQTRGQILVEEENAQYEGSGYQNRPRHKNLIEDKFPKRRVYDLDKGQKTRKRKFYRRFIVPEDELRSSYTTPGGVASKVFNNVDVLNSYLYSNDGVRIAGNGRSPQSSDVHDKLRAAKALDQI